MISQEQLERILSVLPKLRRAESQVIQTFQREAHWARIPAGKDVFALGDQVNAIALLISGVVRVYKIGETGREITLYRFSTGESCILTASAILNNEYFSAVASVEQDAEAIMIPAEVFRDWINQYNFWREFVFELLSQRLQSVIEIVDKVAFGRLDGRIAALLLERVKDQNLLTITHQEIADELGSSREVISRILGGFASQNLILLKRGTIEVLDPDALKSFSLV